MSKGIVGNWVVNKAMFLLLAFVLVFSFVGGAAVAQDVSGDSANWRFHTMDFDYQVLGATAALGTKTNSQSFNVKGASAILAASDADKDVFKKRHDGAIDITSKFGKLLNTIFKGTSSNTSDRGPIIANIEKGEPLHMVAVIQGVSQDVVAAIRQGNASMASTVINLVSAEFDKRLFAGGPLVAGIRPTSVTGVNGFLNNSGAPTTPNALGFKYHGTSADSGSARYAKNEIGYATMLIIKWDGTKTSTSLIVTATDPELAKAENILATLTIKKKSQSAVSNLIGIEPVDTKGNHSGPAPDYSESVSVIRVIDTMSRSLFDRRLSFPKVIPFFDETKIGSSALEITPVSGTVSGSPVQYRASDVITIRAKIKQNESYDGEPTDYFGANADKLVFANKITGGQQKLNSDGIIDATNAYISVSIKTKSSNRTVNNPVLSTVRFDGSNIVHVTFPVARTLETSGAHEFFNLTYSIADDVGHASGTSTPDNTFAVDTAAPVVSGLSVSALGSSNVSQTAVGYRNSRVISRNAGYNKVYLNVQVQGNGEDLSKIHSWFKMTVDTQDYKKDPQKVWTSQRYLNISGAGISGGSAQNFVTNISGGQTLGATAFIGITNNTFVTVDNPSLILSVSDDARNPAFAWYGSPDINKAVVGSASSLLTKVTYGGKTLVRSATIDSTSSFISAFSPSTFATVKSVTFSVDNNPPHVSGATFSVISMPRNYWGAFASGSSEASKAFNQLRETTEALNSAVNLTVLTNINGAKTVKNQPYTYSTLGSLIGNPQVFSVTRGTAAFTGKLIPSGGKIRPTTRNQLGSPVKLVVQFQPSGRGADSASDVGKIGFQKANDKLNVVSKLDMNKYISSNYIFAISSDRLGWTTYQQNLPGGWKLIDATQIAASNVGFATFVNWEGILTSKAAQGGATTSINDGSVVITVADRVKNFPELNGNSTRGLIGHSNPIIVDISAPQVSLTGGLGLRQMVGGTGGTASTVLLITRTQNLNITGIKNIFGTNLRDARNSSVFSLVNGATYSGFVNGKNVFAASKAGAVQVQAGDMIIISATFLEPDVPGGEEEFERFRDNASGFTGAFPFILDSSSTVAGTSFIGPNGNIKYGTAFKTIAADFSDFVVGAKDVLPDVSAILGPKYGSGVGSATASSIIEATWFYSIGADASLNGSIAKAQVRGVTLFARDLSGNVTYSNIPVATAEFTIPVVNIVNFEIHIPSRSIARATIQKSGSWNVPASIPNAFTISVATANLNNSTLTVVAQANNGPFTNASSGFITANFSQFGGSIAKAPSKVTYSDPLITQPQNATSATVVTATFVSNKFNPSTKILGTGKKVIVTVTGSTLAAANTTSTGIVVDQIVPDLTSSGARTVSEEVLATKKPSNGSFDQNGDGVVRPNQAVVARASWTLDSAETAKKDTNNLIVLGNFSDFGFTTKLTPSSTDKNGSTLNIKWGFNVPSNAANAPAIFIVEATDAAGNGNTASGNSIFINGSRPQVLQNVLSASNQTSYATGSFHLINQYYEVGRNNNGTSTRTANGIKTIVRSGDKLRLTSSININDGAFSDISVWTDASQVLGSGFANTTVQTDALKDNPGESGKVTSGGIVSATWTIKVNGNVKNATQARLIVNASNDAKFESVAEATRSVNFMVDNNAPEIKIDAKFFSKGKESSTLVPNNNATASVIVYATFTDYNVYTGNEKPVGYPGTVLVGANDSFANGFAFHGANIQLASSKSASAKLDQVTKALISLKSDAFISSGNILPDFWVISDKTGVKSNGGSSSDGEILTPSYTSIATIKNSTNFVLTAWFGVFPEGLYKAKTVAGIPITKTNNAAAKLVAYVSDSIGNRASAESASIKLDATPPLIAQVTRDASYFSKTAAPLVNLDILSSAEKHLPAVYGKDGYIQSVTRVSSGTKLLARLRLLDSPATTDNVQLGIEGDNFDINSTASIVSEATLVSTLNFAKKDLTQFTLTPPNNKIFNATVTVTVGSKAVNSHNIVPGDPLSGAFGYPVATKAQGFKETITASALTVHATDVLGNSGTIMSRGLNIDTEGPRIKTKNTSNNQKMHHILGVSSREVARSITASSGILNTTKVNLSTGQWFLYAATMVVDGTDDHHFKNFKVDWAQAFETDVDRLVDGSEESGSVLILSSATRSLRFATSTIQIKSNASPSNPVRVRVYAEDFFGNPIRNTNDKTYVETGFVAINADGPRATELTLIVNGVSQANVGTAGLGIGNGGKDATAVNFEVGPGTNFEIEAIINTVAGRAPQKIVADFSDLYPNSLKNNVNEVVPSATEITAEGTVRAVWKYIAYNFTGILNNPGNGNPLGVAFADIGLISPSLTVQLKNGPIAGASTSNATAIGSNGFLVGSDQNAIRNLKGLPFLQVQPNAQARRVAAVTITIDEQPPNNLFGSTQTRSRRFAIDTQTPIVSVQIPFKSSTERRIERKLPAKYLFTSGSRIGFPTAPNLASISINTVPPRVKGMDTVYFVADVTNETIDHLSNDRFRPLPGTTFDSTTLFSIDSDAGKSTLQVQGDFSDFGGTSMSSVIAPNNVAGSNPEFHAISFIPNTLINQNKKLVAANVTLVKATYAVVINSDIGITVANSQKLREATFLVVDDAGNKPYNQFDNTKIKTWESPKQLGVDNVGPTISGALEVVIKSGTATTSSGEVVTSGNIVPGNSSISAGSVLAITATINESVDSPLDILNNSNYGPVTLTAAGIQVPAKNVVLQVSDAVLSGNSIQVPFTVAIPKAEEGFSTKEFRFIISASDTVGNTRSRESSDLFKFDARPSIVVTRTGGTVNSQGENLIHAGDSTSTVLSAAAFDVGGVKTVSWSIVPATDVLELQGVAITSPFTVTGGAGVSDLSVDLSISATPSDNIGIAFVAVPTAVDVEGNVTTDATQVVIINQPAILSGAFGKSITSSAGADISNGTELSGDAGLSAAGADIREVTIPEGSTLQVSISAADVDNGLNGDSVVLSATGSGVTSSNLESVSFGSGKDAQGNLTAGSTGTLQFVPGFKAVSGDAPSASYAIAISAWDSVHTVKDYATLLINVTAQSATPEIQVVSIDIAGAAQSSTVNDNIVLPELSPLTVVLRGTDAGGEDLMFNVVSNTGAESSDLAAFSAVSEATSGVVDATVVYTPTQESSDINPIFDSVIDPSIFTYSVSNSSVTSSATKLVDISNVSQGAQLTVTAAVNGGAAQPLESGGTVNSNAGQSVTVNITATDPDLDRQFFPDISLTGPVGFTFTNAVTEVLENGVTITNQVVIKTPSEVLPDETTSVLNYQIEDNTGVITNATFAIEVVPTAAVAPVDEIILAQGQGGTNQVRVRNFDSKSGIAMNAVLPQFNHRAVGGPFLAAVGGGEGRSTFISVGDLNADGKADIVETLGIADDTAVFPNLVIPRNLTAVNETTGLNTFAVIGNTFNAFPKTGSIGYSGGELRSAVGDFKVDGENLIAVAQGFGSVRGLVRLFSLNTETNRWEVAGQFQPLDNVPTTNNANGGVSLNAADVDGDGLAELIAGQTSSDTSLTQFTVLNIDSTGNLPTRANFVGMPAGFRGRGGVELSAADLDGDGSIELVASHRGVGATGNPGSLLSVIKPTIANNAITGYTRPGGTSLLQVVGDSTLNPGGGLRIGSGELDGNRTNGKEIIFGSGTGAPQSFYRVVKLTYSASSNEVTGFNFLIGPAKNVNFIQQAFSGTSNPSSGAVNVRAANISGQM